MCKRRVPGPSPLTAGIQRNEWLRVWCTCIAFWDVVHKSKFGVFWPENTGANDPSVSLSAWDA